MATTAQQEPRAFWPANGLATLLDVATASHRRAAAFLVLVALIAFLPGFFRVAPIDRDEARFAQATKQMVESGDYVDIRYQDEVRYKKPVGIYWLQAAAVHAGEALGVPEARTAIWLYRLPSLIGAIGAVLVTYWASLAFVSRRGAYLAGLMMATSILLGVEARLAKTDAMLLLACVATMGALARAYLAGQPGPGRPAQPVGWGTAAIFWTAMAGGILLKGPLILFFSAATAVTLIAIDRRGRWLLALKPLPGLAWMLLLVLPWFVAILTRSGDAFLAESVGRDFLSKLTSGQESHGAPPGYYFLLFWLTFWPAAPLAAVTAPGIWTARRDPGVKFLLAWLIPAWIVFELVITKLPHYVLPLYPAIAILIATGIERKALSDNPHLTRTTMMWPIIAALVPVAGVVGVILLRGQLGLVAWPFAAAALIFGFLAWRLYEADGVVHSFLRATVAAILMGIAVFEAILPLLRPLFPARDLVQIVAESGCPDPAIASAGYHEPSLVFLLGTETRLTDGGHAADFMAQGDCRIGIIESRQQRSYIQRAEAIGLRYRAVGQLEGINISGGRPVTLSVFASEGGR
jgi:4-amino-4-deoxy-L-arabinose transferase-like glycosyltransferase